MKLEVKDLNNAKVREVEVPESVFSYPYKEHLIHLAVVAWRAAQRSGTHKTKNRNEIRGSGRKLYRQKGTGRARVGDAKTPIRRGGGVAHGPRPRDYTKKLSVREKKKRDALGAVSQGRRCRVDRCRQLPARQPPHQGLHQAARFVRNRRQRWSRAHRRRLEQHQPGARQPQPPEGEGSRCSRSSTSTTWSTASTSSSAKRPSGASREFST